MEKPRNIVKNWTVFLNENNKLPESINVDKELSKLRILIIEKENIINKYKGEKKLIDIISTSEFRSISDKEIIIEDKISKKLWDIMIKYCENGDYDGAKEFIHKSYKDVFTSGKSLLFRSILVHEEQNHK